MQPLPYLRPFRGFLLSTGQGPDCSARRVGPSWSGLAASPPDSLFARGRLSAQEADLRGLCQQVVLRAFWVGRQKAGGGEDREVTVLSSLVSFPPRMGSSCIPPSKVQIDGALSRSCSFH